MNLIQALILGLVEGLTEFLPISSTGHLIFAQNAMGLKPSEGLTAYLIVIQFGAILAVLALYPKRILQLFHGLGELLTGKFIYPSARLVTNLFLAFLPAAVIGLLADHYIETYLFMPLVVVFALTGGAIVMFFAERLPRGAKTVDQISFKESLFIGFCQIFSLIPGTSRSMTTIVGAYATKMSPAAAAEFSFLLGAITLGAASLYKLVKSGHAIASLGMAPIVVGLVAAFVSAFIVVKFFVGILTRFGLVPWAYYRLAMALVVLL